MDYCIKDCTFPEPTTIEAERHPLPHAYERLCMGEVSYLAAAGNDFLPFMPVKLSAATPFTVEPALDGVDAIGVVHNSMVMAATGDERVGVISMAEVPFEPLAVAIGEDPETITDAAYWAVYVELLKDSQIVWRYKE